MSLEKENRAQICITNDPRQTRLDGRCILVKILPIQAHTGLETQTVSSTETGELYGRL